MRRLIKSCFMGAAAASLSLGCQDTAAPEQEEGWSVEQGPAAARPLSWCSPAPVPYDLAQVPSLPAGVALEGFCDASADASIEEPPTRTLSMDTSSRVLRVMEGDADDGMFSEETFTFDERGRVVFVTRTGMSGFYGASEGTSSYSLNLEGEVVHKVASELNPLDSSPLVKHQEWEGDRLLWRTERAGEDGPMLRRWEWTWEDDRLVLGALIQDPDGPDRRVSSSRWAYHVGGAPASVERRIDGELVEREGWTLREDGSLASRTRWARSAASLAEEQGEEVARWTLPSGLDDHQLEPTFDGSTLPWRAATSHTREVEGADCARLPRGAHGYPADEGEYHLGVEAGARPSGMGFAYGSDTYMWFYGDDSWFGHDGVASNWIGVGFDEPDALEVTIEYDARGTMTRELASLTRGGRDLEVTRERTLDEAGRVIEDAVDVSSDGMTYRRAIEFSRDARGAIVSRTLRDAGGDELTTQTWSRDERGRVTRHAVDAAEFDAPPAWAITFAGARASQPSGPDAWVWRHEGDHVVARGVEGSGALQRMTYDDEGRLVERVGEYANREGSDLSMAYDSAGRIVERCQGSGGWTSARCVQTTYDAAGRVSHRTTTMTLEGATGDPTLSAYNLHVCE